MVSLEKSPFTVYSKARYKKDFISTGNLSVDTFLGGGICLGKMYEFWGKPSSGKSTFAYFVMGQFQKEGKRCLLIDTELSSDAEYLTHLGVDVEELIVMKEPKTTLEYTYDSIREALAKHGCDLIVLDSVRGAPAKREVDGQAGDASMGVRAKTNNQQAIVISHMLYEKQASIIFINHQTKSFEQYGSPHYRGGGESYKHALDVSVRFAGYQMKEKRELETTLYDVKNKLKMGKNAEMKLTFNFDSATWTEDDDMLYKYAQRSGVEITQAGAFYTVEGERFQGKKKLIEHLKEKGVFSKSKKVSEPVEEKTDESVEEVAVEEVNAEEVAVENVAEDLDV